jgi:hypothetical protein
MSLKRGFFDSTAFITVGKTVQLKAAITGKSKKYLGLLAIRK